QQWKTINSLEIGGLCGRCRDVVAWKIKYKKYKPLTAPKKCTQCGEKRIKFAYHILCSPCTKTSNQCAKCAQKTGIIGKAVLPGQTPEEQMEKTILDKKMKELPERQRRSILRNGGPQLQDHDDDELDEHLNDSTSSDS
ncbi:PREDICTED: uncharacterized protein C9orf85 homolog, partial [Priapulus caudatus]|uniref:Uncharacterized protein C9orf85 homolog n=1 Tax=Priapulus caudatus TaxID=37621 RepID=A0ABM1EQG0_PRICU